METLYKAYCLFVGLIAIFAAICCPFCLFKNNYPALAIACLCLVAMAAPYVVAKVKDLFKK